MYYLSTDFFPIMESVLHSWRDYLTYDGHEVVLEKRVAYTASNMKFDTFEIRWHRPFSKNKQYKHIYIALQPQLRVLCASGEDQTAMFLSKEDTQLDRVVEHKQLVLQEIVAMVEGLDNVSSNAISNINRLV